MIKAVVNFPPKQIYGGLPHYEPNSYGQWQEQPAFREPLKLEGNADFWNFREDDADYYDQPRRLFNLMNPQQQQALFDNTARALGDAPDFIKKRHIDNCTRADAAYGCGRRGGGREAGEARRLSAGVKVP